MKKILAILCCLGFIGITFADIGGFVDGAQRGLLLFGRNVLGVLFPFFFITGLLSELGFFAYFRKVGVGAPVFALSLLGGYPTGARMLSDLYLRGEISRTQAIRISTYTSTCSPIFIIATVGTCFFQSAFIGVVIFLCHSISAVLNGLLYRKVNFHETQALRINQTRQLEYIQSNKSKDISDAITNSLNNAVANILSVGGLIIVFFIAANQIQVLFRLPDYINLGIIGILELTNGIYLASTLSVSILVPLVFVSFGGLAVAMQGFLFLKSFRMPFWFYLLYKGTQTIIAVLICLLFLAFSL